jgi:hypothetical protein
MVSNRVSKLPWASAYLGHHADNEALLLDVVRLDSVAILENLAYFARLDTVAVHVPNYHERGDG